MFETVAKLLALRQLTFDAGKIELFSQRICMFPAHALADMQKQLDQAKKPNAMYYIFKDLGSHWAVELDKHYKVKHMDIAKWGRETVTMAGWGVVKIIQDDPPKKLLTFRLENSALVEFYGKADHPIDDIVRGMVAGAACVAFSEDMDAIETKCKAMGDMACEFTVKPAKEFDLTNPSIKKQFQK